MISCLCIKKKSLLELLHEISIQSECKKSIIPRYSSLPGFFDLLLQLILSGGQYCAEEGEKFLGKILVRKLGGKL
jgi:hypothetical protein